MCSKCINCENDHKTMWRLAQHIKQKRNKNFTCSRFTKVYRQKRRYINRLEKCCSSHDSKCDFDKINVVYDKKPQDAVYSVDIELNGLHGQVFTFFDTLCHLLGKKQN